MGDVRMVSPQSEPDRGLPERLNGVPCVRRFDETGGAQPADCEHSSVKQGGSRRISPHAGSDTPNVRYTTFRPPDWCHAIRDVASASELPSASTLRLRSMHVPSVPLGAARGSLSLLTTPGGTDRRL